MEWTRTIGIPRNRERPGTGRERIKRENINLIENLQSRIHRVCSDKFLKIKEKDHERNNNQPIVALTSNLPNLYRFSRD